MKKHSFKEIVKNPALHLIKNHYVTNTWPRRNEEEFQNLEQTLIDWGMSNVTICDIGPGGIARGYEDWMPTGSKNKMSLLSKSIKKVTGALETRARNNNTRELITFEPREIYNGLHEKVGINRMTVIEKYQRVINAVKKLDLPRTTVIQADIEDPSFILPEADVYVALYVLNFCSPETSERIHGTIPRGKILVTSAPRPADEIPYMIPEFIRLHPGVYYKGQRNDKVRGWGRKGPELDYTTIEPIATGQVRVE